MDTSGICVLVVGALLLVAIVVCWVLKKDYLKYANLAKPILNSLLGVLKSVNGLTGNNEVIRTIITVISVSITAAGKAEELWLNGELEKQKRPEYAGEYIKKTLSESGIEVTPSVDSIINGAIALTCYFMPHGKKA